MASSSSSSLGNPEKVCVVGKKVAKGCSEFWIYMVDLKSAGGDYFTRRDPTFRIKDDDTFANPCFCVLGSTLYVFQGYEYDYKAGKFITLGKTVYTHPLPSSSDAANLKLTRRAMSVAKAPLKGAKWRPTAVPTPDGKQILVVSTGFRDFISCLELYDPSRQTSTLISAPPLENPSRHVLSVKFIGPRTVLFLTDNEKQCCLTLDYDHLQVGGPKWVDQGEWSTNMERMRIRDPFIIRHGWCFTPSSAHDISNDHRLYGWDFKHPSSSSGGDHLSCIVNDDITALSKDDVDSFCTLRVGRTLRPFVMLDVYKFDFFKYREQVAEVCSRAREEMRDREKAPPFKRRKLQPAPLPGVKILKSIRFFDARQLQLDDEDYDSFTSLSFFSIPPSSD